MTLGKTIQELRKQKNVTQEELAAELGVTAAAVSKWENGYTLPDILMLCALADFFQVTTDELLGRCIKWEYAVIAAQTMELGHQIADIAKEYGIMARGVFTDFAEAADAGHLDSTVRYILAGFYNGFYGDESGEESLECIASVSPTDQDVLNGFRWFFKTYPHK